MKSRIPKIWFSLALALPIGYGTFHITNMEQLGRFTAVALFYANVPARLCDAVTNLEKTSGADGPDLL
jgi:hypothetical protein